MLGLIIQKITIKFLFGDNIIVLPLIFIILIFFITTIYLVLDGFVLGVGIIFPFLKQDYEKIKLINSIAPIWDSNETWLVLASAMIYGIFPFLYGTFLSIFYIPIFLMIIGLIFRGMSLEFYIKSNKTRIVWNYIFCIGSLLVSIIHGILIYIIFYSLYNNVNILKYKFTYHGHYPNAVISILFLINLYVLLGSNWIIIKSSKEDIQENMFLLSKISLTAISLFSILLFINNITHSINIFYKECNIFIFIILMIIVRISFKNIFLKKEIKLFCYNIMLFIYSFSAIGFNIYYKLLSNKLKILNISSPHSTLHFIFYGVCIIIPILFIYTIYMYWTILNKLDDIYY